MQRGAYAGIAAIGVPLLARGGDYFIQFTGANSATQLFKSGLAYDTAADAQAALNAFIQANNSAPIPFNGGIGSSSNWSGSVYSGIAEVEPVWVEGVGNNVASLYYRPGYWAAPEGGYVGIMGNYYGTKWGFQCTRTCAGS